MCSYLLLPYDNTDNRQVIFDNKKYTLKNIKIFKPSLHKYELSSSFLKHKPDIVLTIGDRYETIATAISATYLNIPLAHTMGGEVSGTIDESIRHAITKFSHIHFPASKDAYNRILRLGENKKNVFLVGCPRIDEVKKILNKKISINTIEKSLYTTGVGNKFHLNQKFLLFSQHPVTTEYYLSSY